MATILIVRVLDVNYAPLAVEKAQAMFDNQKFLDMPKGQEAGTYTLPVPDGAGEIFTLVRKKDFFDAGQRLVLKQEPGKPVPSFEFKDKKQEINTRNLRVTRQGSDVHLEVFVVLGQLADATQRVNEEAASQGLELKLETLMVRQWETPILNPQGSGKEALRSKSVTVAPQGKLLFAERKTVPKLIAVYLPLGWWLAPNPYKEPVPNENQTHYRVFFHPYIPWSGPYPYGRDYLDLVARYLLKSFDDNTGNKALVHQQEARKSQRALVFPVGSQGSQMGTLNSQTRMLRLLQEINYWALRMDGVSYPIHTVGSCALSGFSGGFDFLATILQSKKEEKFYRDVLTDLYVFDGVPNNMPHKSACGLLKNWFQEGKGRRTLRIYTQNEQWWNLLKDISPIPGEQPVLTPGPANSNAKEANTSTSTILHCPYKNLFTAIDKTNDYWFVHQYIPARFMEPAAAKSVIPS